MRVQLLRMLGIATVLWVCYYGLLFAFQRRLIYPAPRGMAETYIPDDARRVALALPFGEVPLWYLPALGDAAGPVPAILFAHGNGERAEDWLDAFALPRQAGYAVAVLEYPGYGQAAGSPSEATITATVLAAYDWLEAQPDVDRRRIIGFGRSLGGGVVAKLVSRRSVSALVLESSFASLRDFARGMLAPGFLVRDPFDNRAALAGFRGPLLVLHGRDDAIAPVAHGRELAALVPGGAFVELPCGHNDCARPWAQILAFLDALR